jgi:probable HAF family extracellular repeat protein
LSLPTVAKVLTGWQPCPRHSTRERARGRDRIAASTVNDGHLGANRAEPRPVAFRHVACNSAGRVHSLLNRWAGVRALLAVTCLCAAVEPAASKEKPLFIELPREVLAVDVGAGGFVVVGTFYSGGAFHWMPTSGDTAIGGTQGAAVSRDGKTIVGRALDSAGFENAAIWTGGTSWRLLGSFTPDAKPCDLLLSGSFGASDDGKVVVGLAWDGCSFARAFRWEESTGMVDLGSTVPGRSSRANNVSGDGRVVIGWQEDATGFRTGARWINGAQELFRGPSGMVGEAFGVNRDGTLVLGANCTPSDAVPSGWTWTPAGGVTCFPVPRPPGLPAPFYQVLMQATSEDGRVMVGAYSFGLESESLIWIDGQVFFLKDYLRQNGVPDAFDGWVNTGFAIAVTPDGRTIVGYGAGRTAFQGYMVVLPELDSK